MLLRLRRDPRKARQVSCQTSNKESCTSLSQFKELWISDFDPRIHRFQTFTDKLAPRSDEPNHYSKNIPKRSRLEYRTLNREGLTCPTKAQVRGEASKVLFVTDA